MNTNREDKCIDRTIVTDCINAEILRFKEQLVLNKAKNKFII